MSAAPIGDRRVRRSRAALMRVAVDLVSERGTADVPLTDLAEAADVSRPLVYQHFGDRDTLLLEAALDLVERELVPHLTDLSLADGGRGPVLAAARHFTRYRPFYRAMFTGACAYRLNRSLSNLLGPLNRQLVELMMSQTTAVDAAEDLLTFVTGGWSAIITTWVIDGKDPLDPEELADRFHRLAAVLLAPMPLSPKPPVRGM